MIASLLKRRRWTNELIRELLPGPRYLPFDGRFVRAWSREDVSRAESTPQFAQGRNRRRSGGEPVQDSPVVVLRQPPGCPTTRLRRLPGPP